MSETWKQWEGQTVNGEFPLLAYLGGSRHSAVFVTRPKGGSPERAAIKLVRADPGNPENQLHRWKKAAELSHPNLLRIYASGRCEIDGTLLLYVVMDAAEEDLSQILPERTLTPEEARQLIPPVLDALDYIHGRGLVHGRLRPSNILATGDRVMVSADTLRASSERVPSPDVWSAFDPPEGSTERLTAAADVWSLAVTLVQALTQQRPLFHPAEPAAPSLPEHTPEPFREIARHCLLVDPQQRWSIADVRAALQPKSARVANGAARLPARSEAAGGESKGGSRLWLWLLAAIVLIGLIVWIMRGSGGSRTSSVPSAPAESQTQKAGPPSEPIPEAASRPAAAVESNVKKAPPPTPAGSAKGAVLQEVMPQIAASARRTIDGKIRVVVRVDVDASGHVTEATLVSPGPSKYFARTAEEAARQWTFTPPQAGGQALASQWTLRFGFRRSGTEVSSAQNSPR